MSNRFQDNLAELVTLIRKLRNESTLKPKEHASVNKRFDRVLAEFVHSMASSYSTYPYTLDEFKDLLGEVQKNIATNLLRKDAFENGDTIDGAPDDRIKGWIKTTTSNALRNDPSPQKRDYRYLLTTINNTLKRMENSGEFDSSKIVEYRFEELRRKILNEIDVSESKGKSLARKVAEIARRILKLAGGMIERRDLNDLVSEITGIYKPVKESPGDESNKNVVDDIPSVDDLPKEIIIDIESATERLLTRLEGRKDPRLLPILCYKFVHELTYREIQSRTKIPKQTQDFLLKRRILPDLYNAIKNCSRDPDYRIVAKFREKVLEGLSKRGIQCEA